ncbi:MAG: hypothetical protein KBT88_02455 [Gammaproteobacteria bacterium]|nr:hypothetical protein [Gammaproteobacteria bacterium]MBQ0838621.1 hypothetical protein [Gammaproteobacteria bacterium]
MCGGWGVPEDDESSTGEGGCGKKKDVGEKVLGPSFDKGRRGFTTAAMASPVLMSLLSKPAWSGVACSISGLTSGNVSSPGGLPAPCSGDGMGCTPGYWKNNPEAWFINTSYSPGTCKTYKGGSSNCSEWNPGTGDKFSVVFGCSPLIGDGDTTLMDILQLGVKDNGNVVADVNHAMQAHWVAALLNASVAPLAYGSNAQQIIDVVCAVAYGQPINNVVITIEELHATLELMNERGCLLNAHGFCEKNHVNNLEGQCIPSCVGNTQWDVNNRDCYPKNDPRWGTEYCSVQDAIDGKPWCTASP